MSRRNRHDRGALLALAVIVGGAVLSAFFGFLGQAQRQPDTQPRQERSANVDPDAYNGWRDTYAQWAMVFLAAGGTGVGIWTIVLLQRTIRETRKGNRINRSVGEAQVRAYIEVREAFLALEKRSILFPLMYPVVTIKAVNNGNSPALAFRWIATVSFGFAYGDGHETTGPSGGVEHARDIPPTRELMEFPALRFDDILSVIAHPRFEVGLMVAGFCL